jgi:hypothetical protein
MRYQITSKFNSREINSFFRAYSHYCKQNADAVILYLSVLFTIFITILIKFKSAIQCKYNCNISNIVHINVTAQNKDRRLKGGAGGTTILPK